MVMRRFSRIFASSDLRFAFFFCAAFFPVFFAIEFSLIIVDSHYIVGAAKPRAPIVGTFSSLGERS